MRQQGTYPWGMLALLALVVEVLLAAAVGAAWWVLHHELPAFRWERPELLWALAGGPILALLFLVELGWRNRALRRFAAEGTRTRMIAGLSATRTFWRYLLMRLGLALVVVAMAGPQYGTRMEEVRSEGIDVVVAMDVSNSMACMDLKPDRMEVARRAMARLIDKLQGDRLGIVVFAGEAYVQLPLTTDRAAAKLFLNTINTSSVGTQGTAIGAAIELAQASFGEEATGSRAIIVITDGENHEDDAEGAASRASEAGIVVHTVGMGTPQGGPIPVRRQDKGSGFRKDRQGNTVVTRMDEAMLQRIAAAGGGAYVRATERSSGMEALVDELRALKSGGGTSTTGYRYTAHEHQFQYPLAAGILLIALSFTFHDRRRARLRWLPQLP